jgi:hypothetical protein
MQIKLFFNKVFYPKTFKKIVVTWWGVYEVWNVVEGLIPNVVFNYYKIYIGDNRLCKGLGSCWGYSLTSLRCLTGLREWSVTLELKTVQVSLEGSSGEYLTMSGSLIE